MAVATGDKVRALARDLGAQNRLAEVLGVNRAQVSRWIAGGGIDPINAERVDVLELVFSSLLRIYEPDAARAWLVGLNPLLGDRRPVDLIRRGRAEELLPALRAERADSFA
jgi:uncharacterized protein (DUF2384 family)